MEDHYFQERLEQFQTPFDVFQLKKRTQTLLLLCLQIKIGYMTLLETLTYHNCPVYHQFEVNLVSWI